tara:strand:- start:431 stop:1291 length:861 start_codon:yes stop_codon:yes gene_type:complete
MPYDIVNTVDGNIELPEELVFDVGYEPCKVPNKKYVFNQKTGEYLNVVGSNYQCVGHHTFAKSIFSAINESIPNEHLADADIKFKTARRNGFMMMEIILPNLSYEIYTEKHSEKIGQRIIALHGVDGLCSNLAVFGQISFFCTNKMIRGEHDKVLRKNTSGFSIENFEKQLMVSQQSFYSHAEELQRWANISTASLDAELFLEKVMKSKRQAKNMFSLYEQEVSVRGKNAYSLYSAFTNYTSYADERNGFPIKETGNDTQAVTMWQRELDVTKWISSKPFKELVNV